GAAGRAPAWAPAASWSIWPKGRPMNARFSEQVAVVTGAASPLGIAIAQRLGREGARLALLDIDESAAARVRDEVGADAVFFGGDLSDGDVARTLFDEALRVHG